MKRFLKQILIFGMLFFIFDKVAILILLKTQELQSDKKLEYILEGKFSKELLILGSSRGIGSVDAALLQRQTGLSAYNISFRGSDITFQEFILKTYLKFNQHPDQLVLVIDNPYLFMADTNLEFRYDRLYPLAYNNYINDFLINSGKHSLASKGLYFSRIHDNQLKFKSVKTENGWEIDSYGSQMLFGHSNRFDSLDYKRSFGYKNIKEDKNKIESFLDIQQLCMKNDIDLHFVFPPNYSAFNDEFYERFKSIVTNENNVLIYDQSKKEYHNQDYFYDLSHLNIKGAQFFTKELSSYLMKSL